MGNELKQAARQAPDALRECKSFLHNLGLDGKYELFIRPIGRDSEVVHPQPVPAKQASSPSLREQYAVQILCALITEPSVGATPLLRSWSDTLANPPKSGIEKAARVAVTAADALIAALEATK